MEEDVSEWWNYWTSCVVVVAVITVSVCLLGPIRRIARGSGGSGTEGEGKCPLTGEDNGACPVTREEDADSEYSGEILQSSLLSLSIGEPSACHSTNPTNGSWLKAVEQQKFLSVVCPPKPEDSAVAKGDGSFILRPSKLKTASPSSDQSIKKTDVDGLISGLSLTKGVPGVNSRLTLPTSNHLTWRHREDEPFINHHIPINQLTRGYQEGTHSLPTCLINRGTPINHGHHQRIRPRNSLLIGRNKSSAFKGGVMCEGGEEHVLKQRANRCCTRCPVMLVTILVVSLTFNVLILITTFRQ